MAKSVLVGVLIVAICGVCLGAFTPAFLWSGIEVFSGKYAHITDPVSSNDVVSAVKNLLGAHEATSLSNYMNNQESISTVIVFSHEKLSTEEFVRRADANHAFKGLQSLIKDRSASSIVLPRVESAEGSLASSLAAAHLPEGARLVLVGDAADLSAAPEATHIQLSELSNYVSQHVDATQRTLIVVPLSLDEERNLAMHGSQVSQFMELLAERTQNHYAVVFTSDHPLAHSLRSFARRNVLQVNAVANNNTNVTNPYLNTGYLTPGVLNGLLTAAFMLLVLYYGITCVARITPPDRFEGEDLDKKKR